MNTNLAPAPEQHIEGDAWQRSGDALDEHSRMRGRISQGDLERMEAEFLASGGRISEIPMGISSETDSHFNNTVVASNTKAVAMYEARAAHNRREHARRRDNDAVDVDLLARRLPHVKTARELCRECRFSYDKLDRLIRTYFADDPAAMQYARTSRDEREQLVKAKYRGLRATMNKEACARALHMQLGEMNRIIDLYGLDRAQATPQRKWNNVHRPATREAAEQ